MKFQTKFALTLVELLVAVTLTAIMTAGLYATFAGGMALSRQGRGMREALTEARRSLRRLEDDLQNMVPFTTEAGPGFRYDEDGLWLVRDTGNGPEAVRYFLRETSDGRAHRVEVVRDGALRDQTFIEQEAAENFELVREVRPLMRPEEKAAAEPEVEPARDILARHLAPDGLAVLFGDEGEGGLAWQTPWSGSGLPQNIRVELAFTGAPPSLKRFRRDILRPAGDAGPGAGR